MTSAPSSCASTPTVCSGGDGNIHGDHSPHGDGSADEDRGLDCNDALERAAPAQGFLLHLT